MKRYFATIEGDHLCEHFLVRTRAGLQAVRPKGALSERDELILFPPGTDISAFPAAFPPAITRSLEKSAAFSVEDELASPPQDVQAVIGVPLPSGRRLVWCADRKKFDTWFRLGQQAGAGKVRIIPPQSLFRHSEPAVRLNDVLLTRQGERPVAVDLAWPSDVLRLLLDEKDACETPPDPLRWLAGRAGEGIGLVDLAVRSGRTAGSLASLNGAILRVAAATSAVLVLVIAQSIMTQSAQAKVMASLNSQTVGHAGQDASRAAAASAQHLSFRQLSGALFSAAAAGDRIVVLSLNYTQDERTQLRALLSHADFQSDEQLRERIRKNGIVVQTGESRMEAGRVISEIVLEPPS